MKRRPSVVALQLQRRPHLIAIRPSRGELRSVLESNHVLAVKERLQLGDALGLYERAAMNAEESVRTQLRLERVQRVADQVRRAARPDAHVIALREDAVDVGNVHEQDAVSVSDRNAMENRHLTDLVHG